MIGNNILQAAIVARLKADSTLTTWLAARSTAGEIREMQYQGAEFEYPCVRVAIAEQLPTGDVCYLTASFAMFEVRCYSEKDSSEECDQLSKLVLDALIGKRLSGTGFATMSVLCDSFPHAVHTGDKLWESFSTFRAEVYET